MILILLLTLVLATTFYYVVFQDTKFPQINSQYIELDCPPLGEPNQSTSDILLSEYVLCLLNGDPFSGVLLMYFNIKITTSQRPWQGEFKDGLFMLDFILKPIRIKLFKKYKSR